MKLNGQILAALRTFEAAASCGSFTKAAKQLHITAAAVSQQMANLESQLKLCLFERHSRGIRLTPCGEQLLNTVQPSLDNIAATIDKLQVSNITSNQLRIKSTPSFAYKWLVPRLQHFYQEFPEIKIQIFADSALVDKATTDYDLVIDFGPIPYPGNEAELLLAEALIPVMSPAYAQQFNWHDPKCWAQVNLLHDAMPWLGASPDSEWRYWFNAMALDNNDSSQGHSFNRTDLAMEAAAAGQGVALARQALLGDDISKGNLVAPFAPIKAGFGYYLLQGRSSKVQSSLHAIESFKGWIQQQVLHWEQTQKNH
ncbi:MAG: LysR family transcriptional regulator [Gammaproteobacteria bacterium]|nr:LysR family transcriptional regulator [Gammaproteobacteria bacterium]